MNNSRPKHTFLPLWILVTLATGILVGYAIKNYTTGKRIFHPLTKFSELDEVLFYVRDRYVDSVDIEHLEDEAIAHALKELDPHSIYLNKEVLMRENEQMDGQYEGVGIEFFIVDDTVTVVTAMSGGPSESVGIRAGDKIVQVNDSTIAGVGIMNSDVVRLLKGKEGTKVSVGIKRSDRKKLYEFEITRAPIALNSIDVSYMLNDSTGYIKINRFSKETHKEFKIELNKLVKMGMVNLIIDLRDNGGGIMRDALEILDELISGNKILLSAEGRKYKKEVYEAYNEGIFEEGKVAVLINEGSASASEIVAGAIQDWDRGIIVGRRSFGKGLVQQSYMLNDGSAIRLTVARYYTPSGRSIQRSYKDGVDSYYDKFYHRINNGELVSKDSIRVDSSLISYTLLSNRKVFGGGGIVPDIFVPIDTTQSNSFTNLAYSRGLIQEFTYDYFSNHESTFTGFTSPIDFDNQFFVSSSLYNEFVDYVINKTDHSEIAKEDITFSRQRVSNSIKALLGKQLYGDKGFYLVANDDDKEIMVTLKSFENGDYETLLKPASK